MDRLGGNHGWNDAVGALLGGIYGWNDAVCALLGAIYGWNDAVCAPRRVGCSKIVIKICSKKYLFLVLLGC